jgi:hypothetical protein
MTSPETGVACRSHGSGYATFVCQHLAKRPRQLWCSDYPARNDAWPDASCASCNRRYLRGGKWTKGIASQLKVLCHHCYEDARSIGSTYLGAGSRKAWQRCVPEACAALHQKQERLKQDFALGAHKRWDWDQDSGRIVFSNDGVAAVSARVHFIGTLSSSSGTWLWAWANFNLERRVRDASRKIRAFGEAHGFPRLTTAKWQASEADGWEMAAIGARLLRADGVYRTPRENGFLYMVLTGTRVAKPE